MHTDFEIDIKKMFEFLIHNIQAVNEDQIRSPKNLLELPSMVPLK